MPLEKGSFALIMMVVSPLPQAEPVTVGMIWLVSGIGFTDPVKMVFRMPACLHDSPGLNFHPHRDRRA
jgi:hypothetical protein